MASYRVRLAKESFKFSATHFTLMSASDAERLHGHNYHVSVECVLPKVDDLGMAFEFNSLKPLIKAATEAWDERVLIARQSPHLQIRDEMVRDEPHWCVDFGPRAYRFPKADVQMLDCQNVTSEELARLFASNLAKSWRAILSKPSDLADRLETLTVTVEETRGQSASYSLTNPLAAAGAR